MKLLEITNLTLGYQTPTGWKRVLTDFNLALAPGEIIAIQGVSGSGKSTLLRAIAGFVEPEAGDIQFAGESVLAIPAHKRNFVLMFQDQQLFEHLNVSENVSFALKVQGKLTKKEQQERVASALAAVELNDFATAKVTELSGGQQQRVALARAMVSEPKLMLLDEPLASLDEELRLKLAKDIRLQLKKQQIPAIVVTHSAQEAELIADRVITLGS